MVAAIMRQLGRHRLCGMGLSDSDAGERKQRQRKADQKGQYGSTEPHFSPSNDLNPYPALQAFQVTLLDITIIRPI
jgi:hypothetical protein